MRRLAQNPATATAEEPVAEADEPAEPDGAEALADEVAAVQAQLEASQAVVSELEEQVGSLNDQLVRLLAEQQNVRTIAKRDVENARQFGVQKFGPALPLQLRAASPPLPPEPCRRRSARDARRRGQPRPCGRRCAARVPRREP
eukprot:SAG31_NODE_2218_length_6159_cov_3.265182_1_plen_144_part_00